MKKRPSSSFVRRSLASNSLPLHTRRVISASFSVSPSLARMSSSIFCLSVFSSNALNRAWSALSLSSMIFFCSSVSSLSLSSHAPASSGLVTATLEGATFSSLGTGAVGINTSAMVDIESKRVRADDIALGETLGVRRYSCANDGEVPCHVSFVRRASSYCDGASRREFSNFSKNTRSSRVCV